MSRNLKQSAIDYLANTSSVRIAHLVKIELTVKNQGNPTYTYVTDYANDIVHGGETYEAGKLNKVGSLRQTQGLTNYKLSLEIAGEFQDELARGLVDQSGESYIGRQVEVLRAYLDDDASIVDFDVNNGPMQYFIGDVSDINIKEDVVSGSSIVSWECAGKFQDFEAINGRVTDDASHRGLESAEDGSTSPGTGVKRAEYGTDTGFQHANQTIDIVTNYLAEETRYRTKSSWFGLKSSVEEYTVTVERELELGVDLAAKYIPKVYGVRRVPGIPVFLDVVTDESLLYVVYTFCEGEVDSLLNLYLEDKPLVCSSANDSENRICVGNQAVGDTLSTYQAVDKEAELRALDDAYGDRYNAYEEFDEVDFVEERRFIEFIPPTDNARTTDEGTFQEDIIQFTSDSGRYWLKVYHGKSDQAACSEMVNLAAQGKFSQQRDWVLDNFGPGEATYNTNKHKYWDANSKLLDTCYAVLKVEIGEDTKIPSLEAVISGKLVDTYDSQLTKTANQYTLNPVWQLLDYLVDPISGGGLDSSLIDLKSFYDVAVRMDEITTSYKDSYPTYWRYLGWKSPPGTNTTLIGGDPHDTQKTKMQTNVIVRTENTVTKNIQNILKQFDGTINILGSKYHLSVENNDPTIADITSDEIIGKLKTKDLSNKNKWNSIQASIINPAQAWGTTQINFFNSSYLVQDNNIPKKGNISFSYITNYYTAREWAQIQLSKSRYSRELSFTTYYKYSYLFPNANVTFTYDRFGFAQKVFRVKTCVLQPNGLVDLTLEDYDESIYTVEPSDDASGEVTTASPSELPPRNLEFVPLPSARFSVNVTEFPDVNGLLVWDAPKGKAPLRYDVRDWLELSANRGVPITQTVLDNNSGETKTYLPITGLLPNTEYKFKVRAISQLGKASKYVIITYQDADTTGAQFGKVTNFKATNADQGQNFTGLDLVMSWDPHTNPAVAEYEIEIYESDDTTLIDTITLNSGITTYTYTLANNMSDYYANNGNTIGAYRDVICYIKATNGGAITSERTELT